MTSLAMPTARPQPWNQIQKAITRRPLRSNSEVSSPQSVQSDQFELAPGNLDAEDERRDQFHSRYLSSEEDLSSEDADATESLLDFDDDLEVYEVESAEAVPVRIANKPTIQKPGHLAQLVCIVPATPTLVHVPPTPKSYRHSAPAGHYTRFTPSSSSSSRSSTRTSLSSIDERRRRTIHDPETSRLSISDISEGYSGSSQSSFQRRPSAWSASYDETKRHSMLLESVECPISSLSPIPATPSTPNTSTSFLNSDPFGENSHSSASPTISRSPSVTHKRLRSISKSLVMAKLSMGNKKAAQPPPPPSEPSTPHTPIAPSSTTTKRRLVPRAGTEERGTSMTADLLDFLDSAPSSTPQRPSAPSPERQQIRAQPSKPKLVARGAAERVSPFDYSTLDADDAASEGSSSSQDERLNVKPRNLRRRKSLLGLR